MATSGVSGGAGDAPSFPGLTTSATTKTDSGTSGHSGQPGPSSSSVDQNNGFDAFKNEALEVVSYTGPYKQLWNLLAGITRVVSIDIIHDQLRTRCNKIISALTRYKLSGPIQPVDESADVRTKIKMKIMEKLEIPEEVAVELLCTYLLFEYNGLVVALSTLLTTQKAQTEFLNNIELFYNRERMCLIYCSQVLLANALDENHVYNEVFAGFIASASIELWAKSLCLSLELAKCEDERVEVLHCLALMVHFYYRHENCLLSLKTNYKRVHSALRTKRVNQAEAIFIAALSLCGEQQEDEIVYDFLKLHQDTRENAYAQIPLLSFYNSRVEESDKSKHGLYRLMEARDPFIDFKELVEGYGSEGFKYRHGVGPVALKCCFLAFECYIKYVPDVDLRKKQLMFDLLDCFLKDKEICLYFLVERPYHLNNLYDETLFLFPIQLDNLLSYWNSITRTANENFTAIQILEKATQIETICEFYEKMDRAEYDFLKRGIELKSARQIGPVKIKPGTKGIILHSTRADGARVVGWVFKDGYPNATVWQVISDVILRPAVYAQSLDENTCFKICAIADFLAKFGDFSSEIPATLLEIFPTVCHLLRKMEVYERDMQKKCHYISLVIQVVSTATKFSMQFLQEQVTGLWPLHGEDNLVNDLIIGHECLGMNNFSVTKAFLKGVQALLFTSDKGSLAKNNAPKWKNELFVIGVQFVLKEIFPSFVRWRFSNTRDQYEIIQGCFRVFHGLLNLPESWNFLKLRLCSVVVEPKGSLLALLTTDEDKLQDCRIRPTEANSCLENAIHLGLSLLLRLSNFNDGVIKSLDNSSGSTLVQCMAKFLRHRVIVTVPCLAVKLLTKISQDLNMSIIACVGREVAAFRDLVVMRLSYKSEDTDLKIALLEFLSICVQFQPGMMNHFLQSESLPDCLFSLLEEEDSALPPATLALIRVLVGKGNTILKGSNPNIWKAIAGPLNSLEKFTSEEQYSVITCTLNILSFELYREGLVDQDLHAEVSKILKIESIKNMLKIAVQEQGEACKSLLAFKHLSTLITSKAELTSLLEPPVLKELSTIVTSEFLKSKKNKSNARNEMNVPLAELMLIFANDQKMDYLNHLVRIVADEFFSDNLAVQIPLLACLNKILSNVRKEDLPVETVTSLVQIISKIFSNAVNVYESSNMEKALPLLSLAASTTTNIAQTRNPSSWLPAFHKNMLVASIVRVAHVGLMKAAGPAVVAECLGTLIKLCSRPETSAAIRNSNLSQNLWMPLLKFGTPEATGKWQEVYLLCCELNTSLVLAEKHFYLEETLNFWGSHNAYLGYKLHELSDIVRSTLMNNPMDKNYTQLLQILTFNFFTLHSISAMLPYVLRWRLEQGDRFITIMEGVFVAVQACVGLLNQPNHLLHSISRNSKVSASPFATRLTPQLMEVQTKLWDIMLLGVHIYLEMCKTRVIMAEGTKLFPLLYNMIALPVRVLGKHGDKKMYPIIGSTTKVTMTLEKGLTLLLRRVKTYLKDPGLSPKEKQNFRRETMSEIASLCDSVKRLNLPNEDFSNIICSHIESTFRETAT